MNSNKNKLNGKRSWLFNLEPNAHAKIFFAESTIDKGKS